jgi:hypothetical protein
MKAAAVENGKAESTYSGESDERADDAVNDEAGAPSSLIFVRRRPDTHGRLRNRENERTNEGG